MSLMEIKNPTRHMRELCEKLGEEYIITVIDLEQVIYRDFGNGYDVEISGMNTSSSNKKADIYLWRDKCRIVKRLYDVPQSDIGAQVEMLREMLIFEEEH